MVVTGPRTLADYLAVQKTITGILDTVVTALAR
jgi:hypothetical protein